jgi:hypothetical protein
MDQIVERVHKDTHVDYKSDSSPRSIMYLDEGGVTRSSPIRCMPDMSLLRQLANHKGQIYSWAFGFVEHVRQ